MVSRLHRSYCLFVPYLSEAALKFVVMYLFSVNFNISVGRNGFGVVKKVSMLENQINLILPFMMYMLIILCIHLTCDM